MRLRHVAAATTLALVGAMVVASPTQARPDERPRDVDHFPASVTTHVPPGGTSMITTPELGKDVKKITVTVKPKTKNLQELEDYERFVSTMGSMTKGKRLLTCVYLYQAVLTVNSPEGGELQANGAFATIAGATLLACLQLAGLISKQQTRSSAAAEKCGAYRPSIPATVTQDASGYTVAASGQAQKTRKPKLKVKCRVTGDTVRYTIRPRKKGQSLRKAAGKKLMVGLRSPADAQTTVPVQVTFSTP